MAALLDQCLQPNPALRPTAHEIAERLQSTL